MIRCWYWRRAILHNVDEGLSLPAGAEAHLQRCASCRERYELEQRIARRLTAAASPEMRPPSPFLHAQIMRSVGQTALNDAAAAPARARGFWAALAAAACVLLAGILWLRHGPAGPVHAPGSGPVRSHTVTAGVGLPIVLPVEVPLREWTSKLDEPLENEMQSVYRDSTNAVNFLAKNFLPDQFRSSLFDLGSN